MDPGPGPGPGTGVFVSVQESSFQNSAPLPGREQVLLLSPSATLLSIHLPLALSVLEP